MSQNILNSRAIAEVALWFDATHGYSDQYIVEVNVFNKIMGEVGLVPNNNICRKFPNSDIATVTVNLFSKRVE